MSLASPLVRILPLLLLSATVSTPRPSRAAPDSPASSDDPEPSTVLAGEGLVEITFDDPYTFENNARRIQDRVEQELIASDVRAPSPGKAPWRIHLEVRGHTQNFGLAVTAWRGSELVVPPGDPLQCRCNSAEILDAVAEQIRDAVVELQKASSEPQVASSPPPPLLAPSTTPPAPLTPAPPAFTRRKAKLGGFGAAGIVVAAGGLSAIGYGAGMMGRGPQTTSGELYETTQEYNTPATHAAIGMGIVGVLAGVALIVVDQAVCRNRPHGCRRASAHYTDLGSPFSLRF